jgi:biopolymer transport protein ExbB
MRLLRILSVVGLLLGYVSFGQGTADAQPAIPQPAAKEVAATEAPATSAANLGIVPGESKATEADEEFGKITLRDIMVKGGWLMNVIAFLSFLAIALVIFYLLTMRAEVLYPRAFVIEAQDAAEAGDIESLRELCQNNSSNAAQILSVALEQCEEGKLVEYSYLRDAVEDEGVRQAGLLWQRLQYLMDIAVIAPMVGLLGTVWGMMVSFSGLESGVSFVNKADALANGVAQAMYTTFGGLIVGIFAMSMYDFMRGRLSKLISGMEGACDSVLRRLSPKIRK